MSHPKTRKAKTQPEKPKTSPAKTAKKELSIQEIDFCSALAQHGNLKRAAGDNGYNYKTGQRLKQRENIREKIRELVKTYAEQTAERDLIRREQRKEATHKVYLDRLFTLKTHHFRGDEALVKLIDIGFKSTGEIQATRITAQAGAASGSSANAASGLYAKRLYLPEWRREVIEKLQHADDNPSPAEVPAQAE